MTTNIGRAGSLESCDVLVTVILQAPGSGVDIRLQSIVEKQFGAQIREVIQGVLSRHCITDVIVEARDRGALNYTIESRVLTALDRARLWKEGTK